ncbi:histidine kinase [Streptomyces sp. Ac-502]|uniref:sensor histidine kinase n=1 Tax=Streptomyces sp. Ac-502 TaxID=3342801 RepID=UPI0038623A6C
MPFTSPTPRPYEAAPPRRRKRRRPTVLLEAGTAFVYLAALGAEGANEMGFFGLLPFEGKLALCAGAAALLPFRRRIPVTCLLVLAAVAGILPIGGMLTALVAFDAIRRVDGPRRRTVVLFTATMIPVLTAIVGTVCTGYGSWRYGFALGLVVGGVGILVPGLVGSSRGQQDRLVVALRERAAAAEEARRLIDSASRVEERSRIAAEMHDLVGHRLSLISLHSGGLEMALATKAPELKDEAAQVRAATRDAMNELRAVLGVLGPLGRDTGTEALTDATGTRADIDALAEESRAAGIAVTVRWQGSDLDALEPRVRRAVHRVVRESLTNVHRYATGATVELTVEHTDDRVRVTVRNGAPPAPPEAATGLGTGRGLTGLRERVGLLGGELRTGPTGAGGFLVEATVPAHPASPSASAAHPEASPPPDRRRTPAVRRPARRPAPPARPGDRRPRTRGGGGDAGVRTGPGAELPAGPGTPLPGQRPCRHGPAGRRIRVPVRQRPRPRRRRGPRAAPAQRHRVHLPVHRRRGDWRTAGTHPVLLPCRRTDRHRQILGAVGPLISWPPPPRSTSTTPIDLQPPIGVQPPTDPRSPDRPTVPRSDCRGRSAAATVRPGSRPSAVGSRPSALARRPPRGATTWPWSPGTRT